MINDSPILIRLCGAQCFVVNKYCIMQKELNITKRNMGNLNIEIQIILPGKLFCLLWNVKILQMITQALQMAKPCSYTMHSCGPLEVPPWLTILVSHYLWFNRFCWGALLRGGKFARTTRSFICQGGHFVRTGKVCNWRRQKLRFTWAEDSWQPCRP